MPRQLQALAAFAAMTVAVPRVAPAQSWYVSSEAGRIRSTLDPAAATPSVSLGVRYEDRSTALRVTAGVPTTSNEALWSGVAVFRRAAINSGSFSAGLDLLGNAFALLERSGNPLAVPGPLDGATPDVDRHGHAVAGQVLPTLAYEGVRFQARARAGVSRYASRIVNQTRDRSVVLADLQVTWMPAPTLALSPVVQRFQPKADTTVSYVGMSAIAASSSGSVWASLGKWSDDRYRDPQWSAGARLQVHPNVSLEGVARHTTLDALYLQPAQTSWSIGLSVLLGRARTIVLPVPAEYRGGRAVIRLPLRASKDPVSIAGDFTGWKPAPMVRHGEHWTFTVAMAPGVYHYAFVNSAGEWFVPKDVAGRKDDGMGGHVAVLVVK